MPSPFAVLTESPSKRRARRLARLQEQDTLEKTKKQAQSMSSPETSPPNSSRETLGRWSSPRGAPPLESPRASEAGNVQRDVQVQVQATARRAFRDNSRQQLALQREVSSGPSLAGTLVSSGGAVPPGPLRQKTFLEGMLAAISDAWSTDERKEECIRLAMRKLPMRRALAIWRSCIAERRERERNFRLANEEGVHRFSMQWRARTFFIGWAEVYRSRKLLMGAVHMMMHSECRAALEALREHAEEQVELRERARQAYRWMAPEMRAMRRGLCSWVEFTAAVLEFRAREQVRLTALAQPPTTGTQIDAPSASLASARVHCRSLSSARAPSPPAVGIVGGDVCGLQGASHRDVAMGGDGDRKGRTGPQDLALPLAHLSGET
jgi:hypothetical protein